MRRASALGMYSSERRTFLKETRGISDESATASSWRTFMSGDFTRYSPRIWRITSCESITNSALSSFSSSTFVMAAMRPRYSA